MRRPTSARCQRLLVPLACSVLALAAWGQSGGTLGLHWSTLDGGGASASGGGPYSVGGTIGQPDAGVLAGGSFNLVGGFWGTITDAAVPTPRPTSTPAPSPTPSPTGPAPARVPASTGAFSLWLFALAALLGPLSLIRRKPNHPTTKRKP